jgi:type I restriction enzyme S subunit
VSDLGFLERLLDGAAVEWVPLGEVCVVKTGPNINKALIAQSPGPYPVINSGRDPLGYFNDWNTENEPIGITSRGAGVGYVMWTNGRFFRGNLNYSCAPKKTSSLNTRFLYHFLLFSELEIQSLATYQGIPALNASALKTLPIPIPCPEDPQKSLAIQAEIVRILDAFTALTAELTAELTARKTQYNHYRNQLLSQQEGDVAHLALGDPRIGVFTRGGGLQKKDFVERGIPCIHYGQIYTYYGTFTNRTKSFVTEDFAKKARKAKPGDLVIATTSENDADVCKAVAWLGIEDVAVSSDACFYTHNLNPKYVSYFFQTEQFQKQKRVHITGTKVRRVNADDLAKILIPVPFPNDPEKSLAEQARIVAILDNFDTLTTSLAEGLPREIALRQRQYEHYRNLLLSFPKQAAEA